MTIDRWTAVDDYFDVLLGPDPVLDAAVADSDAAGLPSISVTPTQGALLNLLAASMGARRILEFGTLGGFSTIWLARALPDDGRLVTLEANPDYARVAQANIDRAGLSDRVDLRVGPALDTLPGLAAEDGEPYDLIFIDADKPGYPDYLGWALRHSRPGTLIVADNVVRDGEVADADSDDPRVLAMRRLTELVAAEPRLRATAIQTVGGKGYDGFILALVTA